MKILHKQNYVFYQLPFSFRGDPYDMTENTKGEQESSIKRLVVVNWLRYRVCIP